MKYIMTLLKTLFVLVTFTLAAPAPINPVQALEARDITTAETTDVALYTGALTWYNPSIGLGACGHINADSDLVVAVSFGMFGSAPNPNTSPSCKRVVHVNHNGRQVALRVVDKCYSCGYTDIDLSPGAFRALGLDTNHGRYYGASWWW